MVFELGDFLSIVMLNSITTVDSSAFHEPVIKIFVGILGWDWNPGPPSLPVLSGQFESYVAAGTAKEQHNNSNFRCDPSMKFHPQIICDKVCSTYHARKFSEKPPKIWHLVCTDQ